VDYAQQTEPEREALEPIGMPSAKRAKKVKTLPPLQLISPSKLSSILEGFQLFPLPITGLAEPRLKSCGITDLLALAKAAKRLKTILMRMSRWEIANGGTDTPSNLALLSTITAQAYAPLTSFSDCLTDILTELSAKEQAFTSTRPL